MDTYYDKLPFTLEKEQQDHDFLIFGTGMLYCLMAAHLTKIKQKKGIIIDFDKTYGTTLKTMSLREFHEMMTPNTEYSAGACGLQIKILTNERDIEKNKIWYDQKRENNRFRGYNIDLMPKLFFGNSSTCDLLKDADMDKYMDFRIVGNIMFPYKGKLENVPLSKGTIFQSKVLSILEKKQLLKTLHTLVKLYNHHREIETDVNSTNEFDKEAVLDDNIVKYFYKRKSYFCLNFLKIVTGNSYKIYKMLVYVIMNYSYDIYRPIPVHVQKYFTVEQMINRFGRFVKSCGVYGYTPYLYVDNGIGDIPQAFSRIASIFGSIFILHPKVEIDEIHKATDGYQIKTNLCPDSILTAKYLMMGPSFVYFCNQKMKNYLPVSKEHVIIVTLICKKTYYCKKMVCPTLCHIYEYDSKCLTNPTTMMVFDSNSSSCPEGEIVVTLTTIVDEDPQTWSLAAYYLAETANRLINTGKIDDFILYSSSFLQVNKYYSKSEMILQGGCWSSDLDGFFYEFKERAGKLQHYFRNENSQNSNQEEEYPDYYESLLEKLHTVKSKANTVESTEKEKEYPEEIYEKRQSQKPTEEEPILHNQQKEESKKEQKEEPKEQQNEESKREKIHEHSKEYLKEPEEQPELPHETPLAATNPLNTSSNHSEILTVSVTAYDQPSPATQPTDY